jgi:hypothetical protein
MIMSDPTPVPATPPIVVAWQRIDEAVGHAVARLERTGAGWLAHGQEVVVGGDGSYGCSFAVELADDWTTTHAIITTIDREAPRAAELRRDGTNHWWRDGERALELDGCRDVDVAAAPFTNTFPLNRLRDLPIGDRWTAPFAYVEVPSLRVTRVNQTYTRLPDPTDDEHAAAAWQYHDESYGPFLITSDAHGLVLDYEGLARRIR